MPPLPYCVYILQSDKDKKLYIGFTENLEQRLSQHMGGQVPSTAPRRPFRLIHCEYYLSQVDAKRREKYLKTTSGKRALRIMLSGVLGDQGQ